MIRATSILFVIALLGCVSLASAGYMSKDDYSWIGNAGQQGTDICIKSSSGKYLLLYPETWDVIPGDSCSPLASWGAQVMFGKTTEFWIKSIPQQRFLAPSNGWTEGAQIGAYHNNGGWDDIWQFYDANDDGSFVIEQYQAVSDPAERYYVVLGTSDASITTDVSSATMFTVELA